MGLTDFDVLFSNHGGCFCVECKYCHIRGTVNDYSLWCTYLQGAEHEVIETDFCSRGISETKRSD